MIIPTIHLNGTSKDRLMEALAHASNALNVAYEALKETAPNGRDYYPQGPGALEAATIDRLVRLRKVDEVKNEIDQLAMAIDEGGCCPECGGAGTVPSDPMFDGPTPYVCALCGGKVAPERNPMTSKTLLRAIYDLMPQISDKAAQLDHLPPENLKRGTVEIGYEKIGIDARGFDVYVTYPAIKAKQRFHIRVERLTTTSNVLG